MHCSVRLTGVDNLSDEISRLAQEYDPEREADAAAARSLTQGLLVGEMLAQSRINNPYRVLKVRSVEQDMDEQGNYNPYFTVVTESGHRIRVTVEVE
jgi:hypothetical protein